MRLSIDRGAGEAIVFTETIGRWDDHWDELVPDTERLRITEDIIATMEARGLAVRLSPSG